VAAVPATPPFLNGVLDEFAEVLSSGVLPAQTSHGVTHHLRTTGPPVASRFRRLDAEKLAADKLEFATLERAGILRRSNSPWAAPLHMVRKADGSWRTAPGGRAATTAASTPSRYPTPTRCPT